MYPLRRGPAFTFPHFPSSLHLTEHNASFTSPTARTRLWSEWRPYFNLSRHTLLEKSPRHIIMMRLLQHWFTPRATAFIVVVKHPLSAGLAHRMWAEHARWPRVQLCGADYVDAWLAAMDLFADDAAHLQHKMAVYFEDMAAGDVQGLASY